MNVKRAETIILTKDLAVMRDFYRDKLGLEVLRDDGHVVAFRGGIGMHPRNERHSKPANAPNNVDIALWVDDIHTASKELRGRGVKFTTEPFEEGPIWLSMVTDPEGNDVLIMQRK